MDPIFRKVHQADRKPARIMLTAIDATMLTMVASDAGLPVKSVRVDMGGLLATAQLDRAALPPRLPTQKGLPKAQREKQPRCQRFSHTVALASGGFVIMTVDGRKGEITFQRYAEPV